MYLDDVAELDALVRRVSPKAKLEANGYELDSVEELTEVPGGKIRSMRWFASGDSFGSYLSVDLSYGAAKAIAREYDDALRGVAERVIDALRRSRRRRRRQLGPLAWHWASRMVFIAACSGLAYQVREGWWQYPLIAAMAIVSVGGIWVDLHSVVVVPHRRSEHPSFWRRSGDEVTLVLIGVVVGAIPSAIIAYLTAKG